MSGEAPNCLTHGTPLVSFCPKCRGTKGGRALSGKKQQASSQNLVKARAEKARQGREKL